MTSVRKGGGGVLKVVTRLRILLILNNRSIIHFCGWGIGAAGGGGAGGHKIGNFLDVINI